MLAGIFSFILQLAGGSLVDKVLSHLQKKADTETERLKITALRDQNAANNQRDVIVAGMAHKMFWVAWSIAAIPMAAWFGWGMLDTLLNGALPDVAAIPPGLQPWANTVWSNIFYTGAAAAGVASLGSAVVNAVAKRK